MRWITRTTTTLFVLLAVLAFALSYTTLQVTAANNGKPGWASYGWPLLIDGGLVIFSLAVVYKSLRGESARVQWASVGVFTVATVLFNVLQETHPITTVFVLAAAPVVLFMTFETLMGIIRSNVAGSASEGQPEAVKGNVAKTQPTPVQLKKRESVQPVQFPDDNSVATTPDSLTTRQKRLVQFVQDGQTNKSEIARLLGAARTTVYGDIKKLKAQGVLSENGKGLEIVR